MRKSLRNVFVGFSLLWSTILLTMLPAQAGSIFGFTNITGNNATNAATGEAQLRVDVQDAGMGQVSFRFFNLGPLASSITDVYLDDDEIFLDIATITNSLGVDFSQGASPPNLPGGNDANPDFEATAGLTADSNPPTQPNGVNPGEELTIIFDLLPGVTFADTLSALTTIDPGDSTYDLRIGIHVQGFANGGSESFINNPDPVGGGSGNPVPEPSTMMLFASGLVALGWWRRKRQRS